ncbi:hypothetical protein B0J13DRAFT_264413 [Dactylonectria estremocensis]|uniref:Uncharacterized protein n=1 Tax=Dactylonectria estremocensis TaxID=1079267 RepID=A0A9P9JAH6_9HYPO|nr:hypothetical protein B0J13DRAFT_264413 [Dactylonectria estremocensis]
MADVSPIIPTPPTSHYALSLFLDALVAVFSFIRSIHWSLRLSQLFSLLALPFRLILYPVRFILSIFLTLFAPAIYVASFCMSGVHAVTSFLASLEPLYTFFCAAAGVGIFAGIVLAISSSLITSRLGMQDDDASTDRPGSKQSYLQDSESRRNSDSTDIDWQWLDSPSHRRRPAAGLLSQTIHEEDDDSEY